MLAAEAVTYYVVIAVLNAVAASIALVISLRTLTLYSKLRTDWSLLTSAGYMVLTINFVISSISYVMASASAARFTAWHHSEHMTEKPFATPWHPPHWPSYGDNIALTPLSIIVEVLYVIAYSLIFVAIATSLTSENSASYGGTGNYATMLVPAAMVAVGLNAGSFIILTATVAIILFEFLPRVPTSAIGYGVLAASHAIEICSVLLASPQLMLVAEALRPIALVIVGAGMRRA